MIDGERRRITKREAVVDQLVNKSTTADLRATKMLFDMIKDAEHKAGIDAPPPEPWPSGLGIRSLFRVRSHQVKVCEPWCPDQPSWWITISNPSACVGGWK